MDTLVDPESFVGRNLNVTARADDDFQNDFTGLCLGVRKGLLQVCDQDNDVWEVEVSQVTIAIDFNPEKKPMPEMCVFIPLSATGLSEEGKDEISQNSNITYGDANRSLFTIESLLAEMNFEDDEDTSVLEKLAERFGPLMYIDLEN